MSLASAAYEFLFKRLRGKGFGLGLFNFLHRKIYEGWLQPASVEIHGCRIFLPPHDEGVSENLRLENAWEPEMTREFQSVLEPGMTLLDIGANIGFHSVLGSRLVGPEGRVLAFEPDPANLGLLRKNLAANACANVSVFPVAVGVREASVELNLCASNTGAHSTAYAPDASGSKTRVRMVRLDDFLGPEVQPDVVKMDIEGGEGGALDGMERLLGSPRLKAVFIECSPDILSRIGSSRDELLGRLRRRGFQDRPLDSTNVLCVR